MKSYLIAVLLGASAGAACTAMAVLETTSQSSVASEFKAIQDFAKARPVLPQDASPQQVTEMMDKHQLELYARLKSFYETHPGDPARWSAVLMMGRIRPSFIASFGADYAKNPKDAVIDTAAKQKFQAEVARLKADLAQAADLPDDARASRETPDLMKSLMAAGRKNAIVDWNALRLQVNAHVAKYPSVGDTPNLVNLYMRSFVPGKTPAEVLAEWARFASSPSEAVAKKAEEEMVDNGTPAAPVRLANGQEWMTDWVAATAVAAREGKKLFVDFTGSDWCGFCIKLEGEVFTTSEFAAFARDYVLVRLDFPARAKLPLAERLQNATLNRDFDVQGFPTVLVADATGKEVRREVGYHPGSGVASYLHKFAEVAAQ